MTVVMEPVASWWVMFEKVLSNGLGGMLAYSSAILNSIAAGHSNVEEQEQIGMLAGYGLAQSIANVFQVAPGLGLTNAFDTLISQANGAGEVHQCTLILGRCRAILTLHWLLVVPIAWFSEPLLISLGIDALSAHYAGVFNRINLIGWWFRNQMYASRKFMSNLNQPRVNLIIVSVAVALHLLVLIACNFQLPLEALAWLTVATQSIHSALLFGYQVLRASDLRMERRWIVKNSFVLEGWRTFMKVGIPGVVQFCAECWALEVFTIISGYLGTASVAACTVTYNVATMGYVMASGVSSATSGLVGEAIGKGHAQAARKMVSRFVLLSIILWLPMGGFLFFAPWQLSAAFSPKESVQSKLAPLLQLYAVALLLDFLNQVASAALRSLGRARLPAVSYLSFYYICMLPLAYLLAFPVHLEVFGMYSAYTATGAAMFIVLLAAVWLTPSQSAVVRASAHL